MFNAGNRRQESELLITFSLTRALCSIAQSLGRGIR